MDTLLRIALFGTGALTLVVAICFLSGWLYYRKTGAARAYLEQHQIIQPDTSTLEDPI